MSRGATAAGPSREQIDASARRPVLGYFISAAVWLAVAAVLGLIGAVKLHMPEFFGGAGWLTYGRVWAASQNLLVYGWVSMAGIGFALWALARMSKARLQTPILPITALWFWNASVLYGVLGILGGSSTGVPWMEFPPVAHWGIAVAFLLLAAWTLVTIQVGHESLYISQWLLFLAMLAFPTVYIGACLLLFQSGIAGLPAAAVQTWFVHNAFGLWLTPLGLAAVFLLMPKELNKPMFGYTLASLGVWSFILSFNLIGPLHLMTVAPTGLAASALTVARIFSLFGITAIALSLGMTLFSAGDSFRHNPVMRFLSFAALLWPVTVICCGLENTLFFSPIIERTFYGTAQGFLAVLCFASMALFGAIYHIAPKLAQRQWSSAGLIQAHFAGFFGGSAFIWLVLSLRGLAQGIEINSPTIDSEQIQTHSQPFFWALSLGLLAILGGSAAFLTSMARCAFQVGPVQPGAVTLGDPRRQRRPRDLQAVYRIVFVVLLGAVVAEYFIATYLRGLGFLPLVVVLCLLATLYAVLVAWYLMYLKFEGKWVFGMLAPTTFVATVLATSLIPDIVMPYAIDPDQEPESAAALLMEANPAPPTNPPAPPTAGPAAPAAH